MKRVKIELVAIWLWMITALSDYVASGKDDDVTTYSPKYPTVHNETIQTECTYTIVEVSANYLDVMWLVCISEKHNITIEYCTNDGDGKLNCSGSLISVATAYSDDEPTTSPTTLPQQTSECMPVTSNSEPSQCSCSSLSTVVVALGATVALILALLTLTTVCLAWTCWSMKKRQGVNISKRDRNSIDQLLNPTYAEGDELLSLQPAATPAYETIAPHPRGAAGKVVPSENGDGGYQVLDRAQEGGSVTVGCLETVHEEDMETSYSKLMLAERKDQAGEKEASEEHQYGNLETLAVAIESCEIGEASNNHVERNEEDIVVSEVNGVQEIENSDGSNCTVTESRHKETDTMLRPFISITSNNGTNTERNDLNTGGLKPSTSLEIIHP